MEFVEKAVKEGRTTLSEYESKQVLAKYAIPITKEVVVDKKEDVLKAAKEVGYPLVMKGSSSELAHKTEKGLIRVDIRNDDEALKTFDEFMKNMGDIKNPAVLVQEMVKGQRELVVGMTRDPQFGPCVMFGLGGIFTEILKDISFRKAPLEMHDALEMMQEIKGRKILEAVRGMPAADTDALARILIQVGAIALDLESVAEIDLNPVILSGARPVAVDALVVLK